MKSIAVPLALMLPATAFAEEEVERPSYELALTLSPLVAFVSPFAPGVELTVEWEAGQKFGVGVVGGIGSNSGLVWAGGLQANGYFYGDFSSGLLVGGEYMAHTFAAPGDIESSLGLYVGGKYAFSFGLTGMLHIGGAWGFPEIDIADGGVGPLVNVGVGWSF